MLHSGAVVLRSCHKERQRHLALDCMPMALAVTLDCTAACLYSCVRYCSNCLTRHTVPTTHDPNAAVNIVWTRLPMAATLKAAMGFVARDDEA